MKTMAMVALGSILLLGGCATQAVISDLETDKVKVQASGNDEAVIMAKAREGCGVHKRYPRAVSYRCMDQYCISKEFLFACVE